MDKKKKGITIAAFGVLIALALSFTTFKMLDGGGEAKRFIYHDKTGAMTLHENQEEARYTQLQAYMEAQEKAEKAKKKAEAEEAKKKAASGKKAEEQTSGTDTADQGYDAGGTEWYSGYDDSGQVHTHSYGDWTVDQSSGTKTRYCSCGDYETIAATKVIDQAYQPGYYKTEYREEPNWVVTWWVNRGDGNIQICYSEEEAYNLYMTDDTVIQWGTGEYEQQGTISVPYEVWVDEVPEQYHYE